MPGSSRLRGSIALVATFAATLTLQSATVTLTPSADATLFQPLPNNNMGATSDMAAGDTLNKGAARALLKFDIAGNIPAGSTITSAALTIRVTKTPRVGLTASTFGLHRVLADWGEGNNSTFRNGGTAVAGECSWNNRMGPGTPWTAPGALAGTDYDATISDSRLINGLASFTFTATSGMTSDVQSWLDSPANNFGWILISDNESTSGSAATAVRIASSEHGSTGIRPALVVTFEEPVILPVTTELTAVADTALFQNNPDNNLGGMDFAPIGTTSNSSADARGLFRFDLSNIPPNSTIVSARLNLSMIFEPSAIGGIDYDVHRLLRSWGEGTGTGTVQGSGLGRTAVAGESSWNHRMAPGTAWASPGGAAGTDFTDTPSASIVIDETGRFSFTSAQLAADVESWINDPASNHGWLIRVQDESAFLTARRFATRENALPNDRPTLTVEFEPAPYISQFAHVGNTIEIEFEAYPQRSYAVERRLGRAGSSWIEFRTFSPEPDQRTISTSLPISTFTPVFYRLRTP